MSKNPSFSSRQESLKYYKEQGLKDLPQFLKNEEDVKPVVASELVKPTNNSDVITMKVSTLLGFLALIIVLGALLFGAGYMLAYSMYATAPTVKPVPVVKAPVPVAHKEEKPVQAPVKPVEGIVVEQEKPAPVAVPAPQPVVAAPVSLNKFTLEFAEADDLKSATDISQQLAQNGMVSRIAEVKDQAGRSSFKLYSTTMFANYEDAYANLQTLKKPYSNWGKVVNLNEAESESE